MVVPIRIGSVFRTPAILAHNRHAVFRATLGGKRGSQAASVFVFGKGVFPGRYYVDATLFIVAATVLSVFRIEARHDTEGIPFDCTYSGGLVRCIKLFLWKNSES